MERNTYWFFGVLILILLIVIGVRSYDILIQRNFLIEAAIKCDSNLEVCFVWDCNSEEDLSCDRTPYKKIELPAPNAPHCLEENNCSEFSCNTSEGCMNIYCTDETREEWEICTEVPITLSETATSSEEASK